MAARGAPQSYLKYDHVAEAASAMLGVCGLILLGLVNAYGIPWPSSLSYTSQPQVDLGYAVSHRAPHR